MENDLLDGAFGEPKRQFSGRSIRIATAVREVVVDGEGEVASDGSGGGVDRVGCAHHSSNGLNGIGPADGHGDDRSAGEVVTNIFEKRSLFMLGVVGFDGAPLGIDKLESYDFQATGFDSSGDFADEISRNSAWLDEDKSGFHSRESLPVWGVEGGKRREAAGPAQRS